MKILQLCHKDSDGPGKVASTLNKALNNLDENSSSFLLGSAVNKTDISNSTFNQANSNRLMSMGKEKISSFVGKAFSYYYSQRFSSSEFFSSLRSKDIFKTTYKAVKKTPYDLLHIHTPKNDFMNIQFLKKTLYKKPFILTLHSGIWFTGGCHYLNIGKCDQFKNECGNCPIIFSQNKKDVSYKEYQMKKKLFEKKYFGVVTPSFAFKKIAEQSPLFKNALLTNIPNPINQSIYKPIDKKMARNILNLPQNKILIGFGAMDPLLKAKGFQHLSESLHLLKSNLKESKDIILVTFGKFLSQEIKELLPYPIISLGAIKSDLHLSILYNSLNVLAFPSLYEVLPNTIAESLSCGVPVVAFNMNGPNEQIIHKENGYLAKAFHTEDFAEGLIFILNHPNYKNLQEKSLEKSAYWNSTNISKQYMNFYNQIIENKLTH